jgi:hypothetical protein
LGKGEEGLQDGPAEQAAFNHPHGMSLSGDPDSGTLYVADTENHAIRAVDLSSGEVTTVAGTGQKAHGQRSTGRTGPGRGSPTGYLVSILPSRREAIHRKTMPIVSR